MPIHTTPLLPKSAATDSPSPKIHGRRQNPQPEAQNQKQIPKDEVGRILLNQLLRAVTSIGANFEESVEAESNKDIIHKLSVVKKEAKETRYWLDLISECYSNLKPHAQTLILDTESLIRIFSSIITKKKSVVAPTEYRTPNTGYQS